MPQDKGPVIVTLNCEANPSTDTVEYDRAEWDAMTPDQRARMLDDAVEVHMANAGGGGWSIEDPDDEASVGSAPGYLALLNLAEWLVSLDDPEDVDGREQRRTVTLDQIITRAREALGRKEG